MASNPSQSCCYRGCKHYGKPLGTITTLNGFEVYTSHPPNKSTENGILILTDIIGHRFTNAQLIADQFATNGYFVMMPDLFHGDPVPLNKPGEFDMQKWRMGEYHPQGKAHLPIDIDPIVETCIREMHTNFNCKKLGAVGYCFGGKYVVRHLLPGKIDVGYTAHPSHVEANELKSIKGPLAIAAAELDAIFPAEKRQETEAILKELNLPWQMNLYGGVKHGFAVRGDHESPVVRYAMQSAFLQALEWFKEHLSS
ncbi:hypothetical protein DTO013E5_8273 [Penicillium roqueforti]|uniref:Dienelactone hydrolase n=1 Tax=Penicillium roqueforti (strain FM164) TaxID=1365484 RepID=W6QUZ3_PENRF|nr:uncharacterized protein LCP9604111_3826 [Penicillium roqueforti]XP_057038461.1 uncharacterized protein N7518_005831 [Penicillium psychrosexuale]CDM37954.1 Dienelactone hydrolase [Penicillium roqueforti FM164]KAF9249726.1 hypothetical protein LCP9604111_3826 [Penicillium roqueforti]KAI1829816.1 hypothetical protein CBS147337_9323 [Penicillium roqueforti]KAI2697274.1 hypothetical protein CBS147372_8012 [Penicillium roqueforti]KAI2708094.1 hypothetical protein CBS147318_9698 [Penicillium roqu